jgi:hypothetical protein
MGFREIAGFRQDVDFELRKPVVRVAEACLVYTERLSIDLATISSSVAVWAQSNQVVVIVFQA